MKASTIKARALSIKSTELGYQSSTVFTTKSPTRKSPARTRYSPVRTRAESPTKTRDFAASTKDDVGWEFVGTEKITFDDCQGKFEAAEDFQPEDWFNMSKALRKDLKVYIKPDSSIIISGELDLDYSETQKINIDGKISSGVVLGYFNPGWELKVELKKK